MPLSFRLFSAGFSFFCLGLGIWFLTCGISGKRLRAVPSFVYSVSYLALNGLVLAGLLAVMIFFPSMEEFMTGIFYDIVVNVLFVVAAALVLRRFYGTAFLQGLAAGFLANFTVYTVQSVLSKATSAYSPIFGGKYLYTFITIYIPYMSGLLAAAIVVPILKKSGFYKYFSHLFSKKAWTASTVAVSFGLMCVWPVLNWLYPDTEPGAAYGVFFLTLIVIALFGVQFMAMYAAGQDKIRAQEETIAQQKAHMELLEELQQEIRAFRHDFTNLFSGLTLQAQEGDLEGIQDFMRKTSSYFDEKLGQEIQQMDGLNNIGHYPVRSLLAAKLADMRRRRIHSALEVMAPVKEKQSMEAEDLLRGLGILIDNAMEAVSEKEGKVRIVLLQEDNELYIAVANNYDNAPDLSAISRKGYTTKGEGRGTGLTSYRRIVSRCKGCVTRTYLKDGFFVQELRLPVA